MRAVSNFFNDDSGQDLIEYALLAGFISLVAVAAITSVGSGVNDVYADIDALLPIPVPAP